ncbi:hypothetical protein AX17_001753 [Amanita inopinata Kibby_2008]|nr:hypothetical protein AX17_001753 [Amanita inopinata Kibby_2008]
MTTLNYVEIPSAATRLQSTSPRRHSLRPAPKIFISLPNPSPPPSPARRRSSSAASPPSLSILPQLLLSSTIPGAPGLLSPLGAASAAGAANIAQTRSLNPRRRMSQEPVPLLSIKDPLSVPIMSANFRRFVSCVGPVFWLQDRVEEIIMWRKGWKVTCAWMTAYGFFCYLPQLILCLPHIILIAVVVGSYPFPTSSSKEGGVTTSMMPDQPPPAEASVPWQANIQAIQNLMGAVSDLMDAVKPYIYHLRLSPAHLYPLQTSRLSSSTSTTSTIFSSDSINSVSSASTSSSNDQASNVTANTDTTTHPTPAYLYAKSQYSPYTPHILTLLILTLPPLAYIVSLPRFPMRLFAFVAGILPIFCTHPWSLSVFLPTMALALEGTWNGALPERLIASLEWLRNTRLYKLWLRFGPVPGGKIADGKGTLVGKSKDTPLKMLVQRILDNDRLTDACWSSEMREVELWENERYIGPAITDSTSTSSLSSGTSRSSMPSLSSLTSSPQKTKSTSKGKGVWSKSNLRPSERGPWTRRRDGWNGFSGGIGEEGVEAEGQVSSNLTFSLAPGWAFVETEDWRKDVAAEWALDECGGGDEDGWVYTNDSWLDPRPSPVERPPAPVTEGDEKSGGDAGGGKGKVEESRVIDLGHGGPYVTRRRRWLRRVWYDPVRARMEM